MPQPLLGWVVLKHVGEKKLGRRTPRQQTGSGTILVKEAGQVANPAGSVLFDYLRRPTAPEMPVVQAGSEALIIDESPAPDEHGLERAMSERAIPNWNDREGTPTLGPVSAAPETPRSFRGIGTELCGTLTRIDGPSAGRVVSLPAEQLTIGRSPRAELHLPEAGVSRKHARICCVNGAYVLEDLGSHNGTSVGGKRISVVQLRQGDLIRVGPSATLRFCWMDVHQRRLLEELYESSVRDPLTGAFNRRHFSERLEAEIAFAKRHHSELSLLLLDIDFFKKVNDQHGHLEGDRVLRELARICNRVLRAEDMFARFGGEEFAVLLRGVPLRGAARAGERLRIAIAENVSFGIPRVGVGVSIGCSTLDTHKAVSAAALIHVADQCLYEAKRTGRGRVVAEDGVSVTLDER